MRGGVTGVYIADFRLELQYIDIDDLSRLFVIETIMAVTKIASNLPSYQLRSHLS